MTLTLRTASQIEQQRLKRRHRVEDGDCAHCGREPRGEGVLCEGCREKNNARRRTGRPVGRGSMYSNDFRAGAVAHTTGSLTIREAAEAFEVSSGALWRWRKKAGLVKAKNQVPACHPDQPHYAKRMCRICYYAQYRAKLKAA